jgi:hypothetical protein
MKGKGLFALALLPLALLAGCPDEETPALVLTVAVTGTAQEGETLMADISALDGSGTIEYQWRRVGAPNSPYGAVADAASSTYTVAHADVGKYIRVSVTADGYTVTSAAAGPVKQADINLSNPPAKAVTGPLWDYSVGTGHSTPDPGDVYTIKDGSEVRVTGRTTSARLVVQGSATVILDDAAIDTSAYYDWWAVGRPAIDARGASLTLVLTGGSTVKGGVRSAAIRASSGSVTITGEGYLDAVSTGGQGDPAAIGGGWEEDSGDVSILGGRGKAYNPAGRAIGTGYHGSYGIFTDKAGGHDWPTGTTYEW